ncbi:unnamed protein product [Clavelina lepadiformis]|uniref:Metallo-beta-lactamase domain-containing protein 1 n=1 Tax=Clavelina lepadiformis TaxID=159417 RepID=A0ABP0GFN3_CLALP
MSQSEVLVLQSGYCCEQEDGKHFTADCTVSLIIGDAGPVLVDTSGPWNGKKLVDELAKAGYKPDDIKIVVCTHGHSDHVGNLNLFSRAKFIVGYDIFCGNVFEAFDFKETNAQYSISDSIYVIPTPGHTNADVSVVVEGTKLGTVVVAGDIFENEFDQTDPSIWQTLSDNVSLQQQSRNRITAIADYIIPGHGNMFAVRK